MALRDYVVRERLAGQWISRLQTRLREVAAPFGCAINFTGHFCCAHAGQGTVNASATAAATPAAENIPRLDVQKVLMRAPWNDPI